MKIKTMLLQEHDDACAVGDLGHASACRRRMNAAELEVLRLSRIMHRGWRGYTPARCPCGAGPVTCLRRATEAQACAACCPAEQAWVPPKNRNQEGV